MGTTLDLARDLTADDLDSIPADGRKWELIDGSLHVAPAPSNPHQVVALNLAIALRAARREGTLVLTSPADYRPGPSTNLQPDVLVVAAEEATQPRTTSTPLLVVEVLSPSTRAYDLGTKRLAYEALGVPSCWFVDPDGPMVTVLEIVEGRYADVAAVTDGVLVVQRPFPLRLDVADLLEP